MRDRRQLRDKAEYESTAISMPPDTLDEQKVRNNLRARRNMRKGILSYLLFITIFMGIPLLIIYYYTPFFVFQRLRCRAIDKIWSDQIVRVMEEGYARHFGAPPLYYSDAYNRSVFWGTYEPSRIFAMKSRAAQPIVVGIAWYDTTGVHPLRHMMPFMHNKVGTFRRTSKPGRNPDVMNVRWVVHDGIHYGKQEVIDIGNMLSLEVEFLKSPSGNAWHVRVHGQVDNPIQFVLYLSNADMNEGVEVEAPDRPNDGDWSPILKSRLHNHQDALEAFTLRIYDDHSPLHATAPWRIYGLHVDPDEAFAFTASDTVGGTPSERVATHGKGIADTKRARELQQQNLSLRDLSGTTFTYIENEDRNTFQTPKFNAGDVAAEIHNMIVLKKYYNTDFRLELSLSPADAASTSPPPATNEKDRVKKGGSRLSFEHLIPRYEALSTCQLSNIFRRREKAIYAHAKKVCKPWAEAGTFNISNVFYQRLLARIFSEAFGSVSFNSGHYLEVNESVDLAWEQRGIATALELGSEPKISSYEASAVAMVGSRTDEAFGQQHLTGLQLLFLVRWNKEMVKDVLGSWLIGAQNPHTGFIPSRADFTAAIRSLTPMALRYEHPTFGSPPTILLGLQELLNEMKRKGKRLKGASQKKQRNTPEYYQAERDSDVVFLKAILPSLKSWRGWWHRTQCGGLTEAVATNCAGRQPLEKWPSKPTGNPQDTLIYRWRSRNGHVLPSSGMDDYPRPICPGEHAMEAHVDLFSWVALLSNLITQIEVVHLGIPASVNVNWEAHLNAGHWDSAQKRYADRIGCKSQGFSPYTGYVNLFPVMLGVVRDDQVKIHNTLQVARNELWTKFGLMSVSFDSVRRAREAGLPHHNVWMGPVWPSINLIFLHALKTVYIDILDDTEFGQEAHDLSKELCVNVAETIRGPNRWWEFFSPVDGRGEGSKTFIGTYSLLLGILNTFT